MNRERLSERIQHWVQSQKDESLRFVQALIQINSENHPPTGNEKAYQEHFAGQLQQLGAEVQQYELNDVQGLTSHPAYMQGRDYTDRPNVVGRFPGAGGGRSLLFSGHADTVYAGTESWTYPPFSGFVHEGKLYGRGSYDMKGGMAAACMAVKCLNALDIQLKGDVWIESVVDEEHGGANGTLAGRLHGTEADLAILPEPSNLEVATHHLGGGIWKASFIGKSGIGFAGEKLVSALDAAMEFIQALQSFQAEREERLTLQPPFMQKPNAVVMKLVAGDPARLLPEKVPGSAECTFWIEGYPGMSGEILIQELRQHIKQNMDKYSALRDCPPQIEPLIRYLHGSGIENNEQGKAASELLCQLGQRITGKNKVPIGAGFACDGFMFNLHSRTPAIVLGPTGGNAHAADEYLDINGFLQLIQWYAELMLDWCHVKKEGE